mmetsp:Transcript_5181/g.16230  ORF Transcript_5181/g.16230 Transcript_5181/m.16230 type:complete len:219 (+) Transcript_5181:757-1413(+)
MGAAPLAVGAEHELRVVVQLQDLPDDAQPEARPTVALQLPAPHLRERLTRAEQRELRGREPNARVVDGDVQLRRRLVQLRRVRARADDPRGEGDGAAQLGKFDRVRDAVVEALLQPAHIAHKEPLAKRGGQLFEDEADAARLGHALKGGLRRGEQVAHAEGRGEQHEPAAVNPLKVEHVGDDALRERRARAERRAALCDDGLGERRRCVHPREHRGDV